LCAIAAALIRVVDMSKSRDQCTRRCEDTTATPGVVKPCVERLICRGVEEGYRREAGFLIACAMRRLGVNRQTAAGVLAAWNLRCLPPLHRPELAVLLQSAYCSARPREFGCSWGSGVLSELVGEFCVGKEHYIYLDLLKEVRTRTPRGRSSSVARQAIGRQKR